MLNVSHNFALIYFVFHLLYFQNSMPRSCRMKESIVMFTHKGVINKMPAVALNVISSLPELEFT